MNGTHDIYIDGICYTINVTAFHKAEDESGKVVLEFDVLSVYIPDEDLHITTSWEDNHLTRDDLYGYVLDYLTSGDKYVYQYI